jgi:hypothetical protein
MSRQMPLFVLIGQSPVREPNVLKWAMWMQTADRIVGKASLGSTDVSTVFIGLDYQFGSGPPLLFETMIFEQGKACCCWRCSTWLQAEKQHREVVAGVRKAAKVTQ